MNKNRVVINIKLKKDRRDLLKKIAKESSLTMQSLVSSLIDACLDNKDLFNIKTEVVVEKIEKEDLPKFGEKPFELFDKTDTEEERYDLSSFVDQ